MQIFFLKFKNASFIQFLIFFDMVISSSSSSCLHIRRWLRSRQHQCCGSCMRRNAPCLVVWVGPARAAGLTCGTAADTHHELKIAAMKGRDKTTEERNRNFRVIFNHPRMCAASSCVTPSFGSLVKPLCSFSFLFQSRLPLCTFLTFFLWSLTGSPQRIPRNPLR